MPVSWAVAFALCMWAGPAADGRVPPPRPTQPWVTLERTREEPQLEPLPDGRYRYEDREGGFVAYVRPDGSVEFETITRVKPPRVEWIERDGWFEAFLFALERPPGERDRPDLEATMPLREDASSRAFAHAELVPWGPYGAPPIMIGLGMPLPDMRGGPSKRAQRAFLRRTEGMRDAMAVRWRKAQLDRATAHIKNRIVEIWTDESLSLAARKRLVFELWDEAEAADADSNADADAVGPLEQATREAATVVRRRIEETIRRLAPLGSDAAYTTAELEAFNARRTSRDPFAPYASPTPPP